jgi:hypothetical protein
MFDLFLSEWRRLQRPALIIAAVHLLLQWLAYYYDVRLLDLRRKDQISVLGIYCFATICFSALQLRDYDKLGRWQWLIHRPLSLPAMFGALALAAAAHIAVMIGLPALLAVISIDCFTNDTVDLHHYLIVAFMLEACLFAWLLAAMTAFGRRAYLLASFVPFIMLWHSASGIVTVLLGVVTIALLALVALGNFKADRQAPPASRPAKILAAAVIMPGFHFLFILMATLWFDLGLKYAGAMPGHNGHRPIGGLYEASRIDQRSNILAGLSLSADPRKADWKDRLPKAVTATILPDIGRFPIRFQLSSAMTPLPHVREDGIKFAFDQDLMRFVVTDEASGQVRKQFGLNGDGDMTPFPAMPIHTLDFLVAQQGVYSYTPDRIPDKVLAVVSSSEQIVAAPVKARERYYLLTTRRLVVYLPDPALPFAPWKEVASVPLPSPVNDLAIVDIAELHNLTLFSFTGGRDMKSGAPAGQQTVVTLDPAGTSAVVAHRQLARDYPAGYEHLHWLISPAIYSVFEAVDRIYAISNTPDVLSQDALTMARPDAVWLVALMLMFASAAAAWWLLRYKAWRGWTLTCLVFGLPALATLLALMPRLYAARPKAAMPAAVTA